MEIFVLVVACILFLFTLPAVVELTLFLAANLVLRFPPKPSPAVVPIRRLVLLVPAHNEELSIARCVASLQASDRGPYEPEVVVIADNCTDKTAELARAAGARVLERFDTSVRGKGAAIHYAVNLLLPEQHDAYIIVDADTIVDPNFVVTMGDQFASGKEALQCTYLALNVEASRKIRLMNLALLSMNVLRPLGRELLGLSAGIFGNGFGLTRKLLEEVPYTANSITEDLEYHLKLIEAGRRVRFVAQTRVLADFPVSQEGTETQRARWEGGRFLLQRQFFGKMLGKVLRGRLTMVEPLFELMSLPLSYEVLLLLVLVVLPFQPFTWYAVFGLAVLFLQIVAGVLIHGQKRDFLALLEIPGYLLWKVISLPKILLTSKKGAQWVRTKRD
jgi:cellulose synthase/poly-beta-1,6-N-acetylglucosamine synthase-like glycosyltransferase